MFARITAFKMKSGTREAATETMNQVKDQILGLPGIQQFINVMNDDGSGYVISIVSDEATSNSNADKVKEIWGNFAGYLEEMPTPQGFDVVANWKP